MGVVVRRGGRAHLQGRVRTIRRCHLECRFGNVWNHRRGSKRGVVQQARLGESRFRRSLELRKVISGRFPRRAGLLTICLLDDGRMGHSTQPYYAANLQDQSKKSKENDFGASLPSSCIMG